MRRMVRSFGEAVLFVGIIVAILIEYNIPNWLYQVVRQGPTEQAIYALTPDLVIAHCGTPISHNTTTHPGPQSTVLVFGEMNYHNGTGTVALAFARTDDGTNQGRWVLNAMIDPVNHIRYRSAKSKLAALPWLAGK